MGGVKLPPKSYKILAIKSRIRICIQHMILYLENLHSCPDNIQMRHSGGRGSVTA